MRGAETGSPEVVLSVRRLSKSFGELRVLRDVSIDVKQGDVLCCLGPSGGGKSTLLRCINHLEVPDAGMVFLDGELVGYRQVGNKLHPLRPREVARQRSRIGMVFQHFDLFIHMTALENVMEGPLRVLKEDRRDVEDRARAALDEVGLGDKVAAYPAQLSGGQQQRVAIARSLAMQPRVMLFDEPTSALDPELVGGVLKVLVDLAEKGMTMVVVTHEIEFARAAADQVCIVDTGEIIELGSANGVLTRPAKDRTRQFLGQVGGDA